MGGNRGGGAGPGTMTRALARIRAAGGTVVGQNTRGAIGRLRNRQGGFTALQGRARGNNARRAAAPGNR